VALAPPFDTILDTHTTVFYFEAARNYAYEYEARGPQVSQVLRDTVLTPGRAIGLDAYSAAIEKAEAFRRWLDDELFSRFDVLLAPSAVGEAPEGLGSTGSARFNGLWTLAGTPCVTLPAATGPKGLPLGVQLVGPRRRDRALFDAAAWVEARLG
jgi:Asp-tRNA(Asn)/Glu-tRNA(Gln) amidotransferase A subunit family amidase